MFDVDLVTAEGLAKNFNVTTNSDGTSTRVATNEAGLIVTTEIGLDNSKDITLPDGSTFILSSHVLHVLVCKHPLKV